MLQTLLRTQPHWRIQDFGEAIGRSRSWVKKWRKRLRMTPNDVTVLRSRSRARKRPPPRLNQRVVDRILEIRDQPPDNLRVHQVPKPSCTTCTTKLPRHLFPTGSLVRLAPFGASYDSTGVSPFPASGRTARSSDQNRSLSGSSTLHTLHSLAIVAPTWMRQTVPSSWSQRYERRWEEYRLPKAETERLNLCKQVGYDGIFLLKAIFVPDAPHWLREVPAVDILRRVWVQNFYFDEQEIQWRRAGNLPPGAEAICSPFDAEARYSIKRDTTWTGYKVHLTETCDADAPHLVVHVVTTVATEQDNEIIPELHEALADKDLVPREHLVDQGYSDSHELVQAQDGYDIDLVMPMRGDYSWQAQAAKALRSATFGWIGRLSR